MGVAIHLAGPSQEVPELAAFPPHEFPELQESDFLHLHASVGFDAPEQVGAAPWGEPMATCRVPKEPKTVAHARMIITITIQVQGTTVHSDVRRKGQGNLFRDGAW